MVNPSTPALHPLIKVAAGSVIVASALVVASVTGLLPNKSSPEPVALVEAAAPAAVTTEVAQPVMQSLQAPVAEAVAPAAPVQESVVVKKAPAPVVHKPRQPTVTYGEPTPAPSICYSCGTVQVVNVVTEGGQANGTGAVTGAVLGGVAGHQMGKGKGKDAMTIVGVIGGALAGNATEKAMKKSQHYEVTVRMEDGNVQTFNYQTVPPFSSGDTVRVDGGQLMRR